MGDTTLFLTRQKLITVIIIVKNKVNVKMKFLNYLTYSCENTYNDSRYILSEFPTSSMINIKILYSFTDLDSFILPTFSPRKLCP